MSIGAVAGGYNSSAVQFSGRMSRPSESQMKQAMESLKSSNPELADKMAKVQSRMTELQKSGTSIEDAMKTIESEFGKPSESDMKSMMSAMGGKGMPSFGSGGGVDLSSMLGSSSQIQNQSILSLFENRSSSRN